MENQVEETDPKAESSLNNSSNTATNMESTFERPMSLCVWMFQMSESNNLERISNVLQNLITYSRDNLYKLTQKYELDDKLIKIIQKYCNGDYGFDLNVSKQGIFQWNYIKAILKWFSVDVLIQKLANSEFFELYGQLIEEALIFANDYTFKMEMPAGCKVFQFLDESLSVFNLVVNSKYIGNLEGIMEILAKLDERLQKVSTSELNPK